MLSKKNKPGNPSKNNNLNNIKTTVEELSIEELNVIICTILFIISH